MGDLFAGACAFIGGDPGRSGGVAIVLEPGVGEVHKWPETEHDALDLLSSIRMRFDRAVGHIELVHSMPRDSAKSAFAFGRNYEMMRMGFLSAAIPFQDVPPRVWQKELGIKRRGQTETQTAFKNRLKSKAQQLYPSVKVTLATCDALLIAHFTMVVSSSLGGMSDA